MGQDRQPVSEAVFHILLSLVDDPRHGYGIIQEVERRTGGRVVLGSGTLYSAIKRMRRDGWVAEAEVDDQEDPRRRYYRLTDEGRGVARDEARRLEAMVRQARAKALLAGGGGG
ncbi:MAG: PadR family transcriptional regulator [Longimicrobiales bacterium]